MSNFPWFSNDEVLAVRCLVAAYGWSTAHAILSLRPLVSGIALHRVIEGEAHLAGRLPLLALRGRLAVLADQPYGHVVSGDGMRHDPMRQLGGNVLSLLATARRRSEERMAGRSKTRGFPDWEIDKWGDEPLHDLFEILAAVERQYGKGDGIEIVRGEIQVSIQEEAEWRRKAQARREEEERAATSRKRDPASEPS